jgi:hypothetical protein
VQKEEKKTHACISGIIPFPYEVAITAKALKIPKTRCVLLPGME